jgi:hypothetical protein
MTNNRYQIAALLLAVLLGGLVYFLGRNVPVPWSTYEPTPVQLPPVYKVALTTQFWVGESSDESNGYIPNDESYWDDRWAEHFGGVDDPACRTGYYPCGFVPQENPFYFALPYGSKSDFSLKNRWIEVVYKGKTCYGQWEDVGPFLTDDFLYVFDSAAPSNTFGVGAGLDISPALWDCLGLTDNETTKWRFVDASEVPSGPWTEIITTSGTSWE